MKPYSLWGREDFAQKPPPLPSLARAYLAAAAAPRPLIWRRLRQALRGMDSVTPPPVSRKGICLTNRSQMVRIAVGQPLTIIGERINPTGKKALTQELQGRSL